jgi:hypothetical protein
MKFPTINYVNQEFAHGDYGDYWGIVFYTRSIGGKWIDALGISDIYMSPICCSIMNRYWLENDGVGEMASSIAIHSCCGQDLADDIPSTHEDIRLFLQELSMLTISDLYQDAYGDTEQEKLSCVDDFQRCINVISTYLQNRLLKDLEIWIVDD